MAKFNVYQIFTRLYSNVNATRKKDGTIIENGCGKFNQINDFALNSIAQMGFSHVWYTGVIRHASTTNYDFIKHPANANVVKGKAGSPYAICDYYDVDPDLAEDVDHRMDEFKALIDRTHQHGMKVIIDFVPNHVARNYFSDSHPDVPQLGDKDNKRSGYHSENNFYYLDGDFVAPRSDLDVPYEEKPAKASGNDAFTVSPSVNDWYETVKLNYGRDPYNGTVNVRPMPDTWKKMRDILIYWVKTGIDGFRVDMAEMVPVEFWHWCILQIVTKYPHIKFIAETYDTNQYQRYIKSGFHYLYDKVNFYDIVRGVTQLQRPASDITEIWHRTNDIDRHMLYFLENHDEQRIGSDFFASDPIKARPGMILATLFRRGATMVYFGQEIGEKGMDEEGFSGRDGKTTIFDYWGVELWQKFVNGHKYDGAELPQQSKDLRAWYSRLLNFANRHDAFAYGELYDLMWANQAIFVDSRKVFAFLRYTVEERFLVVLNFSDTEHKTTIKIPSDAWEKMGSKWNESIRPQDCFGNARFAPQTSVNIFQDKGLEIVIPAWDGVVLGI